MSLGVLRSLGIVAAALVSQPVTGLATYLTPYPAPVSGNNVNYGEIHPSSAPQLRVMGGMGLGEFAVSNAQGSSRTSLAWRADGTWFELESLGTSSKGLGESGVRSVNASGQMAGWSRKYDANHSDLLERAVEWDSSGGITELPAVQGAVSTRAGRISNTGMITGSASFGTAGERGVIWNGQTTPRVAGTLGTGSNGYGSSAVSEINASGVAAGFSIKYVNNQTRGTHAVRYAPGSSTPQGLGHLTADPNGFVEARAWRINDAGTIAGQSSRYETGGSFKGRRAVRWLDGQTEAQELEHLGTGTDVIYGSGYTDSNVYDINESGVMVGTCLKWGVPHPPHATPVVTRAVAWDDQARVQELGVLMINGQQWLHSAAADVNESNLIVGRAWQDWGGSRAVLWLSDGTAVDLTSLIDPALGWELTHALAIDDEGWVVGRGVHRPGGWDSVGYARTYLMQVPEPSLSAGALVVLALLRRRRR